MAEITSDVRMILNRDPFDSKAVDDLHEALNRDPSRYRTLREAVQSLRERSGSGAILSADHLRLGVGCVLLGRHQQGIEHLKQAGDHGMAHYYRGIALEARQKWSEAASAFLKASELGFTADSSMLRRAGALRRSGKATEAQEILGKVPKRTGNGAEWHYQRGSLLADEGNLYGAATEFEQALQYDRDHTGSLFQLAYISDLAGNDPAAIEYYQRCVQKPPVPLAALVNLGVLYEDELRFRDAEACYRRVLEFDPNHPRAKLFLKDCKASKDMYYDEEMERGYDKLRQVLETPVTDFELSVRARNCLRKMNIRTLGDLTRLTEAQLLASKNFGETSLQEIKEILGAKGLRLGQSLHDNRVAPLHREEQTEELSDADKSIRNKPISELNLSVRARKCMTKLDIQTVGQLLSYTGDQLLECKNFGVTSLNEVRERLTELGLKLKGE